MARTEFSRQALDDLQAIEEYIAQDNPRAAQRVVELNRTTAQAIARVPRSGGACDHLGLGMRRSPLPRYRDVVYFRPIPQGIRVLRIIHGSRDADRLFSDDESE